MPVRDLLAILPIPSHGSTGGMHEGRPASPFQLLRRPMIIGTRTLFVDTPEGEKPVPIRLYLPEPEEPKWICRYEIDWPEGTVKSRAQGNDMIEAIHLGTAEARYRDVLQPPSSRAETLVDEALGRIQLPNSQERPRSPYRRRSEVLWPRQYVRSPGVTPGPS